MMLAAISHDLRTPLTRMRLRGEFIEDKEQRSRLFRDVDEMQNMVDEALTFFRDDATAEETTSFDLPHVLHTIANDYADQDVDIGYAGPAHAVYRGRPFTLKRAFTNLIDNAAKYGKTPKSNCRVKRLHWSWPSETGDPAYPRTPSITSSVPTIGLTNRATATVAASA